MARSSHASHSAPLLHLVYTPRPLTSICRPHLLPNPLCLRRKRQRRGALGAFNPQRTPRGAGPQDYAGIVLRIQRPTLPTASLSSSMPMQTTDHKAISGQLKQARLSRPPNLSERRQLREKEERRNQAVASVSTLNHNADETN